MEENPTVLEYVRNAVLQAASGAQEARSSLYRLSLNKQADGEEFPEVTTNNIRIAVLLDPQGRIASPSTAVSEIEFSVKL